MPWEPAQRPASLCPGSRPPGEALPVTPKAPVQNSFTLLFNSVRHCRRSCQLPTTWQASSESPGMRKLVIEGHVQPTGSSSTSPGVYPVALTWWSTFCKVPPLCPTSICMSAPESLTPFRPLSILQADLTMVLLRLPLVLAFIFISIKIAQQHQLRF